MKTAIPSQPLSSGGVLHTPTPYTLENGRIYGKDEDGESYLVCDVSPCEPGDVEAPGVNEQDEANAAFIFTACNAYASDQAKIAALVGALEGLEASAVNLHCALQSTAHMDPQDKRIPVITGGVVRDLLVIRDQARAALAAAKGGAS